MGEINQLNIKNNTYYYYDCMIDIKNVQSNISKKDKKPYKDFYIYYIGYITIKTFDKFSDHKNVHSVNPLYLIIHPTTGHFEKKNCEKYLIFDSTDKYKEVFSGIKSEIETINGVEKMYYEKIMLRLELIQMMMYLLINN